MSVSLCYWVYSSDKTGWKHKTNSSQEKKKTKKGGENRLPFLDIWVEIMQFSLFHIQSATNI